MHAAAALPPFVGWLRMADARVGYAVAGRNTDRVLRLWRTADGGRSWVRVRAPAPDAPPTTDGPSLAYFPARIRGTFVVERSTDGGRTWAGSKPFRDSRPAGAGEVLPVGAAQLYLTLGEGAAAGSSAQSLWRSADGGGTWRLVSRTSLTARPGALPFSCDKTGVGFATATVGFAGGDCAGGHAFFYRTNDGGRTWRAVSLAGLAHCACDVSAPVFFGPRAGAFAVVGFPDSGPPAAGPVARVYWTSDDGRSWRPTSPPLGRAGPAAFPAAGVAWVAGTPHGSIRLPFDRLARTTDAGRRWTVVRLPFDAQNAQLDPVGATTAFALVAQHRLLVTRDGGRSWRAVR